MTDSGIKRARSDSVGSQTPDYKRPNLTGNQDKDIKMEDVNAPSSSAAGLKPPPPSAGLPDTPVAASQAADQLAKVPPSMTIRALIVTQDASIIIGKSPSTLLSILPCPPSHSHCLKKPPFRRPTYSRNQRQGWSQSCRV
jgi:hypothetical protein